MPVRVRGRAEASEQSGMVCPVGLPRLRPCPDHGAQGWAKGQLLHAKLAQRKLAQRGKVGSSPFDSPERENAKLAQRKLVRLSVSRDSAGAGAEGW